MTHSPSTVVEQCKSELSRWTATMALPQTTISLTQCPPSWLSRLKSKGISDCLKQGTRGKFASYLYPWQRTGRLAVMSFYRTPFYVTINPKIEILHKDFRTKWWMEIIFCPFLCEPSRQWDMTGGNANVSVQCLPIKGKTFAVGITSEEVDESTGTARAKLPQTPVPIVLALKHL